MSSYLRPSTLSGVIRVPHPTNRVMMMSETRQDTTISGEALGKMMITEVLGRWPETAEVFHHHSMACVGCAVAPFYTIIDAAIVYGLSPEGLVEEFLQKINSNAGD